MIQGEICKVITNQSATSVGFPFGFGEERVQLRDAGPEMTLLAELEQCGAPLEGLMQC